MPAEAFGMSSILAFWLAYILTRAARRLLRLPLGMAYATLLRY
jgi:hypothetical protein